MILVRILLLKKHLNPTPDAKDFIFVLIFHDINHLYFVILALRLGDLFQWQVKIQDVPELPTKTSLSN